MEEESLPEGDYHATAANYQMIYEATLLEMLSLSLSGYTRATTNHEPRTAQHHTRHTKHTQHAGNGSSNYNYNKNHKSCSSIAWHSGSSQTLDLCIVFKQS